MSYRRFPAPQNQISRSPSKSLNGSRNKSMKKTFINPTSPRNPSPKNQLSEKWLAKTMKQKRDKLCNTLDAYVLLLSTNSPMRCLQHNSVLSLYCQTQQKLLCANCVYRSNNHKSHRIHPIQQCYRMLVKDIDLIQRQCEREVNWINDKEQTLNNVFKEEEKCLHQSLICLAQQFEELQADLRKYFDTIKNKMIASLDNICLKQETLLIQLGFYKQIFKKNKLPDKQELKESEENQIKYNHLIGNALMNYSKLSKNQVKINQGTISGLYKKQLIKVKQVKNNVKEWIKEKQKDLDIPPKQENEKKDNSPLKQKSHTNYYRFVSL